MNITFIVVNMDKPQEHDM